MPGKRTPEADNALTAGAAGGGAGIVFAEMVSRLQLHDPLHHYLIVFTPVLTVVCSGLWLFATKCIDRWDKRRFFRQAITEVRERIKIAEADPATSPKHLQELRQMLEKLEKAELEILYEVEIVHYFKRRG
jgi:hypothetical protein